MTYFLNINDLNKHEITTHEQNLAISVFKKYYADKEDLPIKNHTEIKLLTNFKANIDDYIKKKDLPMQQLNWRHKFSYNWFDLSFGNDKFIIILRKLLSDRQLGCKKCKTRKYCKLWLFHIYDNSGNKILLPFTNTFLWIEQGYNFANCEKDLLIHINYRIDSAIHFSSDRPCKKDDITKTVNNINIHNYVISTDFDVNTNLILSDVPEPKKEVAKINDETISNCADVAGEAKETWNNIFNDNTECIELGTNLNVSNQNNLDIIKLDKESLDYIFNNTLCQESTKNLNVLNTKFNLKILDIFSKLGHASQIRI